MSSIKSPVKKSRRPNPYMIFVKEQSRNLVHSCPDEEKSYFGTFLGRKWRSMSVEEKQIYHDKFKVLKEYRKEESASKKIRKRKKKKLLETVTNKSIMRPRKRKKDVSCDISSNLQTQEVNDAEKTEIVLNSMKVSDTLESTGSTNASSALPSEYPSSTSLHQQNSSVNNMHSMPPVDAHHSKACCCQSAPSAFHGCANLKQNSPSSTDMSPPFLGSTSFPQRFPTYPFHSSPWMYPPPFAPQWFPISMPNFYPSPYNFSLPYSHDRSYIGYYASQYGIIGPSTHSASKPTAFETATSANNKIKSAETDEKNGNSEEEDLIVDEDPGEEQETTNASA